MSCWGWLSSMETKDKIEASKFYLIQMISRFRAKCIDLLLNSFGWLEKERKRWCEGSVSLIMRKATQKCGEAFLMPV